MPAHLASQLDDRTHRRGFDNRPGRNRGPARLRRRRWREQRRGGRLPAGGKRLLDFRFGKDGLWLFPVEQAIQSIFDGRTNQQRMARVVNAEECAGRSQSWRISSCATATKGSDIGEAYQAKTDFLSAGRIDRAIQLVQAAHLRPQGLCQFGTDDFALGLGDG